MSRRDGSRLKPSLRPLFWGLLGALALVLLMLGADTRGIWQDEGLTLYQVRLPFREILENQIPVAGQMTRNTVPPLFFLLLSLWGRLFGFDLWTLRIFSILCAFLFIFLLYRVGRRLGDARLGRVAALLAALSPVLWWYAQELRMYAFLLLPATLSFGLLWRWYQSNAAGFPRGTALAYLITVTVMIWTHYIGFYLLAAQLLWLAVVLFPRHPRAILIIGGAALLVALPLLPFALNRLSIGAERDFFFMPVHAIAADVVQSFAFGTPRFVSRLAEIGWLLPLAWALLGLGLWQAGRKGGWALALLLGLGLTLPLVSVALIGYLKPVYQNVRHAYVVAPAFYLLWALGLLRLQEIRRWLPVVVLLLFGYGWALSTVHYFAPDLPLKNDVRPLFETLAERYAPGEVIVLNDPVLQHALEYFAPDVPWEILPPYGAEAQDVRERAYRDVAAAYSRVWVVSGPPDTTFDTWRELKDYYGEHYGRLDFLEFPGQTRIEAGLFDTRGALYALEPLPVAISHPAEFGDGMRFLGLAQPLAEGAWQAGQRLVVQTVWQAEPMPEQDYQVVARLVDGAGREWAHSQAYPYSGLHLTSHWLAGQYLRVPIFIEVPPTLPPATYNVTLHLVGPDGSPRYAEGGIPLQLPGSVSVKRPAQSAPGSGSWLTGDIQAQAVGLPVTLPPATALALWLRLHLEDTDKLPTAFRFSLHDSSGQAVWTEVLEPAMGAPRTADGTPEFPLSAWRAGDTFDLQFSLPFSPDLEGTHTLRLAALSDDNVIPAPQWGGLITRESVELGTVTLTPRPQLFDVPHVSVTVGVEWFNAARLVGYNTEPVEFDRDEPWNVELVWQAIAPTDRPYKVFMHLLDGEGNVVAGADGFLEVPSNGWLADEITFSRHRFEPGSIPAGQYMLIAGLYHEESGERLPVNAPNFAVPLGEITVR